MRMGEVSNEKLISNFINKCTKNCGDPFTLKVNSRRKNLKDVQQMESIISTLLSRAAYGEVQKLEKTTLNNMFGV